MFIKVESNLLVLEILDMSFTLTNSFKSYYIPIFFDQGKLPI